MEIFQNVLTFFSPIFVLRHPCLLEMKEVEPCTGDVLEHLNDQELIDNYESIVSRYFLPVIDSIRYSQHFHWKLDL